MRPLGPRGIDNHRHTGTVIFAPLPIVMLHYIEVVFAVALSATALCRHYHKSTVVIGEQSLLPTTLGENGHLGTCQGLAPIEYRHRMGAMSDLDGTAVTAE